ncbi:MAG: hypothetical protein JSW00_09490 [Thermoplasmata archaeon]|nr:MAG: hypothetical protein JSW00_09490 [Thermoplasmata archaeon]
MRRITPKQICYLLAFAMFFSVFVGFAQADEEEDPQPFADFTHTTFSEEFTATWCGHCPYVADALYNIYESNDYPFYFVAMITDYNDKAGERANDYNIPGYPTTIFDGGYETKVGSSNDDTQQTEDDIRPLIESCGERQVPSLEVEVKAYDLGDSALQISVKVTNLGSEGYGGNLRAYITEIISRYNMTNNQPYHFGFLDYAFNVDINVPAESSWEDEVIWIGSEHHDDPEDPDETQYFGDIVPSNTMVIAAVFNDEINVGGYDPPYNGPQFKFEAHYVDQTAAMIPIPPPNYGVEIGPPSQEHFAFAGESTTYTLTVGNIGDTEDTISLTLSGDQSSWGTLSQTSVTIAPGLSEDITLQVDVPSGTADGEYQIDVTATSNGDPTKSATAATITEVTTDITYGVNLLPDETSKSCFPEESVVFTVTVDNTGNTEDTIDLLLSGSYSYWGELSTNSVSLSASSNQDITLTVNVPSGTSEGDYLFDLKGTSQGDSSVYHEITLTTHVNPFIYDFEIEPALQEGDVNAGESTQFTLTVTNLGNVQEEIELTLQGQNWYRNWGSLDEDTLILQEGAEQDVILTVEVPSDAEGGEITFTVDGMCIEDTYVTDSATVYVTVIEIGTILIEDVWHSPSSPDEEDEISISALVTGDNIEEVYLDYYQGYFHFGPENMLYMGSDEYSVTIGPLDSGDYEYEVCVEDDDGEKYYSGKIPFSVSDIKVPITISEISHSPTDPTEKDEITVYATVSGDGINSVNLDYCQGETCFQPVSMQFNGNDQYTASFGPLTAGNYQYEVRVIDEDGETYKSGKKSITISEEQVDGGDGGDGGILDSDGDGVNDDDDPFPDDPEEWEDTDGDGIGNNADPDDDNDSYPDTEDEFPLDPTKHGSTQDVGEEDEKPWYESPDAQYMILLLIVVIIICAILAGMFAGRRSRAEEPSATAVTPLPLAQTVSAPTTEPAFTPISMPQYEDISCPKCYTVFGVPTDQRPLEVKCPSCGTKGIID